MSLKLRIVSLLQIMRLISILLVLVMEFMKLWNEIFTPRDIIADSMETVVQAMSDGKYCCGCDKNMPRALMAMLALEQVFLFMEEQLTLTL